MTLPDAQPPQSVPAVIGNSHSASVGSILDWFIGFIFPLFGLALLSAFGLVSFAAGRIAGKINGIAGPLIAGIPSRVPFRNTAFPPIPLPVPDFPVLIPNWQTFGATSAGIVGTGTTIIAPRDQTIVSLAVAGANVIMGFQEDLAGDRWPDVQLHLGQPCSRFGQVQLAGIRHRVERWLYSARCVRAGRHLRSRFSAAAQGCTWNLPVYARCKRDRNLRV